MSTTPLVQYVFAKSIDRGGPGIVPDWPQADPALNRFYLVADVDALLRQREEDQRRTDALMLDGVQKIEELRAQLAAMTAERDKLRVDQGLLYQDREKIFQRCIAVEQQLAASQDRCAKLEEALKYAITRLLELATFGNSDKTLALIAEAKQALTPERPPA